MLPGQTSDPPFKEAGMTTLHITLASLAAGALAALIAAGAYTEAHRAPDQP
jgi:hypothetical protein